MEVPLEEWGEEQLAAFEHDLVGLNALSDSQATSFALGEPTNPPVAAVSRNGYSLDTTFIYPYSRQVTTLRQQMLQGTIEVSEETTTESIGGGTPYSVLRYDAHVVDRSTDPFRIITTYAITYETYKTLLGMQPDDVRAYDDPDIEDFRQMDVETMTKIEKEHEGIVDPVPPEWVVTEAQLTAIQDAPEVITEDRMDPKDSARDGAGRIKRFRRDTRFPEITDPETGLSTPQAEYP